MKKIILLSLLTNSCFAITNQQIDNCHKIDNVYNTILTDAVNRGITSKNNTVDALPIDKRKAYFVKQMNYITYQNLKWAGFESDSNVNGINLNSTIKQVYIAEQKCLTIFDGV